MSRRSFTRRFRRETGLGLDQWRQQALLIAALPRLTQGETVTAVALDLGYDIRRRLHHHVPPHSRCQPAKLAEALTPKQGGCLPP